MDGTLLLLCDAENSVSAFRLPDFTCVWHMPEQHHDIQVFGLVPGTFLAYGASSLGQLKVVDLSTGVTLAGFPRKSANSM